MTTAIEKVAPPRDITVVARSQEEMQRAQTELVAWCGRRRASIEEDLNQARVNLGTATASGLDVSGFQRLIKRHEQMATLYEKVAAALDRGYTIVPNMDMAVIAIRTDRDAPKRNDTAGSWIPDQRARSLPAGEGRYVSPTAGLSSYTEDQKDHQGKDVVKRYQFADEFQDVAFPFTVVKPEVLSATAQAMALTLFDEIGVVADRVRTHGDPMIVGRVFAGSGGARKEVSFLIAWFLDTADLP